MKHQSRDDVVLGRIQDSPQPVIKKGVFIDGNEFKSELFELDEGAQIVFEPLGPLGIDHEHPLEPLGIDHEHPWEHQVYVLEGSADFAVGDPLEPQDDDVVAGDMVHLGPNEKHSFTAKNGPFNFLRYAKK